MARFKPSAVFSVSMVLLIPRYEKVKGVAGKIFPTIGEAVADGKRFNGSFRTYGGTERDVNGLYTIDDTAIVETWYRPDIKSGCRIAVLGDMFDFPYSLSQEDTESLTYEILGRPEDIELRHQYLRFKVRAIEGGA